MFLQTFRVWTHRHTKHKDIQTYRQTYIHAYMHAYIHASYTYLFTYEGNQWETRWKQQRVTHGKTWRQRNRTTKRETQREKSDNGLRGETTSGKNTTEWKRQTRNKAGDKVENEMEHSLRRNNPGRQIRIQKRRASICTSLRLTTATTGNSDSTKRQRQLYPRVSATQ